MRATLQIARKCRTLQIHPHPDGFYSDKVSGHLLELEDGAPLAQFPEGETTKRMGMVEAATKSEGPTRRTADINKGHYGDAGH